MGRQRPCGRVQQRRPRDSPDVARALRGVRQREGVLDLAGAGAARHQRERSRELLARARLRGRRRCRRGHGDGGRDRA